MDIQIGTVLQDRYRIEGTPSRGGLGSVFAATHLPLGRRVVIKALERPSPDQEALLVREARTQVSIAHPALAGIFEVFEEDGKLFLVQPFIDGVRLDEWQKGRSREEVFSLYAELAAGGAW